MQLDYLQWHVSLWEKHPDLTFRGKPEVCSISRASSTVYGNTPCFLLRRMEHEGGIKIYAAWEGKNTGLSDF